MNAKVSIDFGDILGCMPYFPLDERYMIRNGVTINCNKNYLLNYSE